MKFVALVSGGKDSCFNILHCLAQGHELTCLANLYPPPAESDEIDSFMYQTVGHDVLNYYSECIGVPMFRHMIQGTSNNQSLEYKVTDKDETEDLYQLLKKVLDAHPDVQGVSVGAILSTYQRTRVEDVCLRLGLTSLSYLWNRDQGELMNEMCQSEMEARIIKVAAIGLNEKHLGKTLQEIHPTLLNLNNRFGVHICGEGGEFETLVLDAPFFKKGRLIIKDKQVVKHTSDEVYYLKLSVEVVPKEGNGVISDTNYSQFVVEPPLLREQFQDIYESISEIDVDKLKSIENPVYETAVAKKWEITSKSIGSKIYISNITSNKSGLSEQLLDIFDQLSIKLKDNKVTFQNIQSSCLLVSSMETFAAVNKIYMSFFTEPLPPARICVETCLPHGILAQLSVVIIQDLNFKAGLHVQSRSYWAPSNIGPYSQTIYDKNNNVASLSGQVPLIPKNMEVCDDIKAASCLSLQHLDNVKEVTGYTKQLSMICFFKDNKWLDTACNVWKEYMDENKQSINKCLFARVQELPKSCNVEWGGLSHKEETDPYYDSEDEDQQAPEIVNAEVKFSNKFDFEFNKDKHHAILMNPINLDFDASKFPPSYELLPVVQLFDKNGKNFKYGIIQYP
ncbi:hypothetical protein BVG19_g454 [[Candida] boidinii]|nr:hypothetical protein BVG19_g454 [[Candida] boidinii]OWB50247.1 catalytic activity protein [[Candida] boidinii]